MMRHLGINMNVTCTRDFLLTKLKSNLAQHSQMVDEARNGYIAKAKKELEKRLEQLSKGKIISLQFALRVPEDYTSVYQTAIEMLEAHTGTEIVLAASEFRQLVQDEWDWTNQFIGSTSAYSAGVRAYAVGKGVDVPDDEVIGTAAV